MMMHCPLGNEEPPGDFLVGQPLSEQRKPSCSRRVSPAGASRVAVRQADVAARSRTDAEFLLAGLEVSLAHLPAGHGCPDLTQATVLRASMRNRTVVATNGPSAAIRSCRARSRSRYAATVKPGTIQMTFRRK